jgi:hypothetical protein
MQSESELSETGEQKISEAIEALENGQAQEFDDAEDLIEDLNS